MGLNIKNEKVCALAKEAAAATGQSQTSVIEQALRELLDRHPVGRHDADRTARVGEIVEDLQRRWAATDAPDAFTTDDLYDENGLPG
jgi:antitoxin VapB